MRLPTSFYTAAQQRLLARIETERLDGVLVTAPGEVAYLIGFFYAVTERPVHLWCGADGSRFVLVPELDAEYAEAQQVQAEVLTYPEYPGIRSPEEILAAALPVPVRRGRIGVTGALTTGGLSSLRRALPGVEWVRTPALAELRLCKQPEEIVLHRQAADICDAMLAAGRELIERALAADGELPHEGELARHVISHGTDLAYERYEHVVYTTKLAGGLVYAGPNSARPHGLPSRRRLQRGDTVILSLGAAVASRFVESERTFVLGDPTPRQRELFEAVHEAQEVGTRAMMVGRSCASVNAECLDSLRAAGHGEWLRHRLGHGIGIGQHEPPWVEDGDETPLRAGMVLSAEPGLYVPGHAGYRISDTVLVTDDGPERLTRYPRSLAENVIAA